MVFALAVATVATAGELLPVRHGVHGIQQRLALLNQALRLLRINFLAVELGAFQQGDHLPERMAKGMNERVASRVSPRERVARGAR